MAIGSNSYGSIEEVEALTTRYLNDDEYDGTTTPTLTQVEKFLDRVSAILNVLLAEAGFAIPVEQADAKLALDDFAVDQAVQLCHATHGAGPYAPGSEQLRGRLPRAAMMEAATEFINDHADGFEQLGATRNSTITDGLECRTEDEAGNDIVPPFHREMIGHEIIDWDPD